MVLPLFDLTGKSAFITGSTKGIGRAIAEAFVDHGARVVVSSRNPDETHAAAAEINARAGRDAAIGLTADLSKRDTLIAAYDAAVAQWGQIDVLICNAAVSATFFGRAADYPVEDYAKLLEGNVVNNVALMNHAGQAMKERRDGVILTTSSGAGVRAAFGVIPYSIAKAGLNHAVRGLAAELAPFNVRVNAIAPGLTRSWSMDRTLREHPDRFEMFTQGVPLRRVIEAEEIAAGMVFLATEGGKAITGQILQMDGGDPGKGQAPED